MRALIGKAVFVLLAVLSAAAGAEPATAIVAADQVPLRAAPRASAPQQAVLWQGETVEVRGERMDYVQIYDYRRERGGFVHASQLRRVRLIAEEAPALLAVLRFVRDAPGAEALGIGFAAAYIQAASPEELRGDPGIEALDALGSFADRLARRASSGSARGKAAEAVVAAHLDVAARYGIKFINHEVNGRMQICYDGDAFRRVLTMRSSPEQRARAALALTRQECINPAVGPLERNRLDEARAETLDRVDASALAPYLANRVQMRRAAVWSALAYQRTRSGGAAEVAAARAIAELGGIRKAELAETDLAAYNDAAMRVSASRWAVAGEAAPDERRPHVMTVPGEPGETCVFLVDARNGKDKPLARRCTYGLVWAGSATLNREGNALALAVQPMESWREIWVFRKERAAWTVGVLSPAASAPDLGYAEFAGWVPGGRQMLVAREARGEGKYQRSFEVVRLDTLAAAGQSKDPSTLAVFKRWQDPSWKQRTLSMR